MDNTLTRTDAAGRPVIERRHWSFSAVDKFYKCPRKFFYYDVTKAISEPENANMKEGFIVHKAMSDYISRKVPLPPNMERYTDWLTTMFTGQPDEVFTEHKMACTFELAPCEYFSRKHKVWLRTVADLLVVNGPEALSVDWKTGQEPDERYQDAIPKNFQLRLTALTIFLHFPQVQNVKSKYIYLNAGTSSSFDMPRSDLREFIPQVYEIAGSLQKAVRTNEWPPHPSGLCKRHCAVTQCQYHGIGRG
jgi:hypothetical protein